MCVLGQESQRHSTSHAAHSPEPGEPPQLHAPNVWDAKATEGKMKTKTCKAHIDLAVQRSNCWKLLNLQRWSETKSQHNNKHWKTSHPVVNLRWSSRSWELTWKGSGVLFCLQTACSAPFTSWKAKEKATRVFRLNPAIKSAINNLHGGTDSREKDRSI